MTAKTSRAIERPSQEVEPSGGCSDGQHATKPHVSHRAAKRHLVVSIGALASGLEAFTQLLRHLPTDTGHGLCAGATSRSCTGKRAVRPAVQGHFPSVREVTNGPSSLTTSYVIPPTSNSGIANVVLKLQPRQLGLEAIKADGGIMLAQDASARFDSMPRSAVAAGCVDFVLSPENIAKELARIATHPYVAGRKQEVSLKSAQCERASK